ncbi:MAG TPA: ribonuclease Z [Pyrinomonadaceae bacterium]|nr:ribonuclease Z [Pyrinomonadaceae bacterium]
MKLVVLGSGTSVPHPLRSSAAHWLETKSGTLLLDIGASSVFRMAQEKLDWVNLDAVWVSHFHLDHLGGLFPFLFGTKHAPDTQARRKPLRIYAPRGLTKLFRALDEAGDYNLLKQPFPVEIREVAPRDSFEILPNLEAEIFSTPHTSESLAIKLTDRDDEASLVFTSDTGYTEALATFARGVSLFLMECSFFRDKPVELHLELKEAIRLAEQSGARRVMLSHFYPEWDNFDLAAEAKKLWDGEIIEARDGLRLEI